jgi:hypothetical protein
MATTTLRIYDIPSDRLRGTVASACDYAARGDGMALVAQQMIRGTPAQYGTFCPWGQMTRFR